MNFIIQDIILVTLEIIVFDLTYFKKRLKKFKEGKYSKFSGLTKRLIIEFFGRYRNYIRIYGKLFIS